MKPNHRRLLTVFLCLQFMLVSTAQEKDQASTIKDGIFDLEISYGPQYNFFVDYGRDVVIENGDIIPFTDFPRELRLLQKRAVGTYFNASISVRLGSRNFLELGHSRTLNRGTFNLETVFPSGTLVRVEDFQTSHRTHFFNLAYKRVFGPTNKFQASLGIAFAKFQQSNITVWPDANLVFIEERNATNSYLEEGFATLGFQYNFYRSGNFEIGVKTKMYFVITAGQEPEVWTIAPTLRYHF